jgi:hypothetical protein
VGDGVGCGVGDGVGAGVGRGVGLGVGRGVSPTVRFGAGVGNGADFGAGVAFGIMITGGAGVGGVGGLYPVKRLSNDELMFSSLLNAKTARLSILSKLSFGITPAILTYSMELKLPLPGAVTKIGSLPSKRISNPLAGRKRIAMGVNVAGLKDCPQSTGPPENGIGTGKTKQSIEPVTRRLTPSPTDIVVEPEVKVTSARGCSLSDTFSLTRMNTPIPVEVCRSTGIKKSPIRLSCGSLIGPTMRASFGNNKVRGVCSSRTDCGKAPNSPCHSAK